VVFQIFTFYGENNQGVEFFVDTEPEQGIVYVRARGNLSLVEKDALVRQVEAVVLQEPGVAASFAFAGDGGLNANTAGAQSPRDAIGQVQFELLDWSLREGRPDLRGQTILDRMQVAFDRIPGIFTEYMIMTGGPAGQKPLHLRLTGEDFETLDAAVQTVLGRMRETAGIIDIEDTRPLPGIDWEIRVDVGRAGRFGADVATVGGMVQLVTRGLMLDTMRVDTSDEEIDIRVRLPEGDRLLATLDTLRVQTQAGMVPLSNFVTREAVPLRAQIDRVNERRYYDVKAAVASDLVSINDAQGETQRVLRRDQIDPRAHPEGSDLARAAAALREEVRAADHRIVPINANERIETLTRWLSTEAPLPEGVGWEWTGEQQDQQESAEFLTLAFSAALGLMFVILLAQFNSFYNAVLVLLAVILSTAGVLIGMLVMNQPFSVIMTGTGVVALAGIVVNNNIVLIDTYQSYAKIMPRIEAIIRTAEARIRPVLLTTITTMAGLTPMMLGVSIDFVNGGYGVDHPAAIWWKQLATAVVFGLGVATILTLVLTPSLLAARVWLGDGVRALVPRLAALRPGQAREDRALTRRSHRVRNAEIIWNPQAVPASLLVPGDVELVRDADTSASGNPLRAAE
jgi:multidrug efflux pump